MLGRALALLVDQPHRAFHLQLLSRGALVGEQQFQTRMAEAVGLLDQMVLAALVVLDQEQLPQVAAEAAVEMVGQLEVLEPQVLVVLVVLVEARHLLREVLEQQHLVVLRLEVALVLLAEVAAVVLQPTLPEPMAVLGQP